MHRPEEHDHYLDFEQIKRNAFVLLNLGYGLNRLLEDGEGDVAYRKDSALFREYGKMYESEISTRLLSAAVTARVLDDKLINSKSDGTATKFPHGEYMLGDDENGEPINLRQCFNKIIHASRIYHELMQLPEVYLSGKQQNEKEWHIRLFLLPFCTALYQWVDHYQRDHT
ncbi:MULTISPECIES: hypothetical protein [unclassified Methylophilus]|uniref:hypothetical protein n=1 Tax=unclassified Methylophilus TaxID=2630143 RepID=UPI0007023B4E|nr:MULTISPECIES: hypothetical protein [unclassified Methylophilus]KQT42613.1 hypothetical protein ASG34_07765 [Methylophilus sp. Leaf416]KQT56798.1 hypothetical protein ASG44_07740 [Methylophilus sp. Leaf459]